MLTVSLNFKNQLTFIFKLKSRTQNFLDLIWKKWMAYVMLY